jgi:hypothetical protein
LNSKGFSLLETVVFIVLAAVVIPIFYLTTQPVIKEMMTPTSYVKARFIAGKKMEQFMAYQFTASTLNVGSFGPSAVTADAAFQPPTVPTTEYAGYQWQWVVTYLDCAGGGGCAGYTGNALTYTATPTNYKQVEVTVTTPENKTYRAVTAVTARY